MWGGSSAFQSMQVDAEAVHTRTVNVVKRYLCVRN